MDDSLNLIWNAEVIDGAKTESTEKSLLIKGELLDLSVNQNGWAVAPEELQSIASQLTAGVSVRADHGNTIWDVLGGTTKGETDGKKVFFEAEIDDPEIHKKILKRRIKTVSIGAKAEAHCSKCNSRMKPVKTCKCEGSHIVIRGTKVREISLTPEPAYEKSEFVPVSFTASVNKSLESQSNESKVTTLEINQKVEEKNMVEAENKSETIVEAKKAETSPDFTALATTLNEWMKKMETSLAAPKAETTPALKAEDVAKIVKEEIEKIKEELKPKEEKKKAPPAEAEEEEEEDEDKEKMPPKKESVGAKVIVTKDEVVQASNPSNPWVSAWGDIRKAAKELSII